MVLPEAAKPLAFYDHPFFGKYPALTRNAFGKGTRHLPGHGALRRAAGEGRGRRPEAGGDRSRAGLPAKVRARQAVARDGKALRFYLNFSGEPQSFAYAPRRRDGAAVAEAGGGGRAPHPRALGPRGGPGVTAGRTAGA